LMVRTARGRSPLRPLIGTIVAVGILAAMLTVIVLVTGSAVRSAGRGLLEPQSAAEERCAGLVHEGTTDSREYQDCLTREMDKSPQSRLGSSGFPVGLTIVLGLAALILVAAWMSTSGRARDDAFKF
jgi:hypothetical protein